jgi:hypothetical protein
MSKTNIQEYIRETSRDLAARCLESSQSGEGHDFRQIVQKEDGSMECRCGLNFIGVLYCMMQKPSDNDSYVNMCRFYDANMQALMAAVKGLSLKEGIPEKDIYNWALDLCTAVSKKLGKKKMEEE